MTIGAVVVLAVSVSSPIRCAATDMGGMIDVGDSTSMPAAPVVADAPVFDSARMQTQLRAATDVGAARGAWVSIAFMDRDSGFRATNGNDGPVETASVSKLFIADDLLFRDDQGEFDLDGPDTALIDSMLRSSDDSAAEQLWNRFGRNAIVDRVAARYGLTSTSVRPGDEWWRTRTTMTDVVAYYSQLIDGVGGLAAARSAEMLSDLRSFTPTGTDGYYQRFGLPDALPGSGAVGVKQGWMCCVGGDWIHLSTGVIGPDNRYIVAMASREDANMYGGGSTGANHARSTMTAMASALFPSGRIDPR
ncbi:serine hydrolase [Actinomycetes bacterium M1A6_2h]